MPPTEPTEGLARSRQVLRPSQLNALARDLLEGSFPMIWVEAEISNLSQPASGHLYFTLKDDRAQVRCALFRQRASRIGFKPANGQLVVARGRLTVYEPRGDYQLVLDHMEPAGAGALRAAFEALREKLAAEGLFDSATRPVLPRLVRRLAVITSPRGAAVRDVISVLSRRFPLVHVDVVPVPVQGDAAAAAIIRALEWTEASGRYDAVLLTRGGGSLEDLWPFNDEALVRRLAAARLPVVAAIGHETDTSLSEFAAALRAPTPSAAAELLVPDRAALLEALANLAHRSDAGVRRRLAWASQGLDHSALKLHAASPRRRVEAASMRLVELTRRRQSAMRTAIDASRARVSGAAASLRLLHPGRRLPDAAVRLQRLRLRLRQLALDATRQRRSQVDSIARALHAVGPLATLERGYAIVLDPTRDRVLRARHELAVGRRVRVRLADGDTLLEVLAEDPGQPVGETGSGTG